MASAGKTYPNANCAFFRWQRDPHVDNQTLGYSKGSSSHSAKMHHCGGPTDAPCVSFRLIGRDPHRPVCMLKARFVQMFWLYSNL